MASITFDKNSEQVARVSQGNNTYNRVAPCDYDAPVRIARGVFKAAADLAADKRVALIRTHEAIKVVGGQLYCDGAVTNATLDVGYTSYENPTDDYKDVLGDAIPVATAGAYAIVGGLASGTGEPGNVGIVIPANSVIYATFNTAGIAAGKRIELQLFVTKAY